MRHPCWAGSALGMAGQYSDALPVLAGPRTAYGFKARAGPSGVSAAAPDGSRPGSGGAALRGSGRMQQRLMVPKRASSLPPPSPEPRPRNRQAHSQRGP